MARPRLDGEGGDVVKKVRMTRARAKQLHDLAAALETTESDVIRRGLDLLAKHAEKEQALGQLIRWAEEDLKRYGGKPPPKIYPEGRVEPSRSRAK
jgi:hypothetical protein